MLDFIAALFALSFFGLVLLFAFLAEILIIKDLIELTIMWIENQIRK